jgi:hypothetical protein
MSRAVASLTGASCPLTGGHAAPLSAELARPFLPCRFVPPAEVRNSPILAKGGHDRHTGGGPDQGGAIRLPGKLPDGHRIPPHTHPKTERVTVISGTFNIGMGDKFDEKEGKAMPAGTYGHWAAGMKHFVWAKGETVLQFHGMGTWPIQYANPDDDPRNQKE